MSIGVVHQQFHEDDFQEFLSHLESFQKPLLHYTPRGQQRTLDRIEQEIQKIITSTK
jgi:hypothetical protein